MDGGGFLGLATATFLQSIEQRFNSRASSRFDLFCGTSTGAIIALALASGKAGTEITALYEQLGEVVFKSPNVFERVAPILRRARGVFVSLHDNGPLRAVLQETFQELRLGDLRSQGKKVLITAFNVTAGRPSIFKTDHGRGLTAHDKYFLWEVALASSAAPMYLPLVELLDPATGACERYCDGGLVANSPALLGYAEAVSHLGQKPADLEILSLGSPRLDLSEHESALSLPQKKLSRGLLGWSLGERIISLSIDGGAMVSDTALKRIAESAGARYVRVRLDQPPGVGLDIATETARKTLRQVGADCARNAAVLREVAPFFVEGESI